MAYEPELERLERRYQDDPARNFAQLAEAYRKANRLDDALTLLQGHLTERPNYVSGLVVLGRCLLDQRNDAEARETFERVLSVDSEHIIALRALGEIAERAGDRDGARRWFARLLDVDPMNDDAEQALQRIEEGVAAEVAGEVVERPVDGRTDEHPGEQAGASPEAAAPDAEERLVVDPEFELDEGGEQFMPRPSGAQPREVEVIGEMEIRSQLEEEAPLVSAVPETDDEPPQLPTGERALDLGPADVRDAADQLAAEGPGPAPGTREDIDITAFDDALGWGSGDRVSRQITAADMDEVERTHEETVAPVSELPGLERAEVPGGDAAADVGRVEGLQEFKPGVVEPLPGFEATAAGETADDESVTFVEPASDRLEVVNEEIIPVVPEEAAARDRGAEHASGPLEDRGAAAERRASLMGLPLVAGAESIEAEEPLVLDAEPEPVVTETMAELYVKQGLLDEARDVYQRLVAQRPGDARLEARLAALSAGGRPARASVGYHAAQSGGQSVREMMIAVLGARPGGAAAPTAESEVAADMADTEEKVAQPPAPVPPSPAPAASEPMDEAFSEDHGDTAFGAPTQPAADEVTLAAIFGEPSPPARAPKAPAPARPREAKGAAGARTPGGFSFDEFFGKPSGSGDEGGERPPRDSMADDEGEEAFRDWLKGLKG